jgi:patatin-related protein
VTAPADASTDAGTPPDGTTETVHELEAFTADAGQEIRLAVVLNGGVSLAVWISGVSYELNDLVQASRRRGTPRGSGSNAYGDLLDALQATARIDVIAGTSAGGINGGFLALGLVHGCDLSGLRTLWQEQGDLGVLLRDPRQTNAPSLLRGEYFREALAGAYAQVWDDRPGVPASEDEDVDLFLTGTLWEGRRSFFADDMGRRITELDHDATFHFTSDPETVSPDPASTDRGNLRNRTVTAQLGVASRCTASFPAAFEPFEVQVDDGLPLPDGRWPSSAGRTNFARSQFVIDGGILRNKPIRPAIDAVYRQSADQQVRRILAYVVPDPGEAATTAGARTVTEVPSAADVMLGVMTRLRSTDSVADELDEIDRRNQETAHRRRARDRLAQTLVDAAAPGTGATDLVRSAYPGYLEVRRADTAESVARLLLSAPGQPPWSRREVAAELRDLASDRDDLPFLPQQDLDAAFSATGGDWRWGHATVRRLGDVVLDVLKRAVWLAPLADVRRSTIVTQRASTHEALRRARHQRTILDAYWRTSLLPPRSDATVATKGELTELRDRLTGFVTRWGTTADGPMGGTLHNLALELAQCLVAAGPAVHGISSVAHSDVDPSGEERRRLGALAQFLLPPGAAAPDVLRNMLRLEVVHVAFTGVSDAPEQAVELVQVSSLQKQLVTGIQLHHFGAFYRQSWRANDWLRGRIDGSSQLVQMLLAPERLKQLHGCDSAAALESLRKVAVGPETSPSFPELTAEWNADAGQLQAELHVLEGDDPLPRTFPLVAERIARRIRTQLLAAELASLATAVIEEPDPVPLGLQWAEPARTALRAHGTNGAQPTAADLDGLLEGSAVIGHQTIAQEAERGSDTFTRTVSHAAATLTSNGASVQKPQAVIGLFKALRGYALLLWVLGNFLAGRSSTGRNLTSLVLGVGGAFLALAVLIPGIPMLVPLVGVVLILAVASIAALRQGKLAGQQLTRRLVLVAVVVAVALVGVLIQRLAENKQGVLDLLLDWGLRLFLVLVVLGVGWFLGRPTEKEDKNPQ